MIPGTDTLRDAAKTGRPSLPIHQIFAERWQLDFSSLLTHGITGGDELHDAGVSGTTLLHTYIDGSNLYSTKKTGANWDAAVDLGTNVDTTIAPSMVCVGSDTRIFYLYGGSIYYKESTDAGVSYGAAVTVGASADCKAMAATSKSAVHYVSTVNRASQFHVWRYNGSWSKSSGPEILEGVLKKGAMDAIAIGDKDLIVYEKDYMLWGMWYANARWSQPFRIIKLDDTHVGRHYRRWPRVSSCNGIYTLCYRHAEGEPDRDGVWTNRRRDRAYLKSKDGRWWSSYEMCDCSEAGAAKMVFLDDDIYLLAKNNCYVSDATQQFEYENAALREDITNYVEKWALNKPDGGIALGSTTIHNHDGHFNDHAILDLTNRVMITRKAGYTTGAGNELATMALEEMDNLHEGYDIPEDRIILKSRDRMKWMREKQADTEVELLCQARLYDQYEGEERDEGLGHTAIMDGYWSTEGDTLSLRSSNTEGFVYSTLGELRDGNIWMRFMLNDGGTPQYAGLVFRGDIEGENMLAAYYDLADDKIYLKNKYRGDWTTITSTSTKSWTHSTWYWLMVKFQGANIRVLSATNGVDWTEEIDHTLDPSALKEYLERGYVGLIGYGFSPEDEEPPWDPPPYPGVVPPNPPPGDDDWDGIWLLPIWGGSGSQHGILRTEVLGGASDFSPTWATWNTGINMGSYPYCRALGRDPWNPKTRLYALMSNVARGTIEDGGRIIYRREYSGAAWGSWTAILTESIIETTVSKSFDSDKFWIGRFTGNINAEGHLYTVVRAEWWDGGASLWRRYTYFFKSTDYGDTWTVPWSDSPGAGAAPAKVSYSAICARVGMLVGTSGYSAGSVIIMSYRSGSSGQFIYPLISVDGGGSFTTLAAYQNTDGWRMMFDPNDQSICYAVLDGQAGPAAVVKFTNHGANRAVMTAFGNVNRAIVCKHGEADTMVAAAGTAIKVSDDSGATVESKSVDNNIAGAGMVLNWNWERFIAAHSYNNGDAVTYLLQLSPDGAITWYDKTGNLAGLGANCRGACTVGFSLDD